MEPATGALIASAIAGSISAYGASKGSQDAAAAADARTGGLLSSTKAALATASEKANKLEAEVARLKIEIARCGGLQSQLDALSGPELAFKNAKAEVLRRAGVEFLLPELIEFLPDRASIERMKKVLDFPTDLVDTLNRMTLRKFYETRVLKVVPPMAPAPSAPPAVAAAAAAAPPSEMDAELEALRGGRRTRRPRRAKRSRRGRGGANGAAQSEFAREAEIGTLAAQFPTPAAPAPAPAAPAPAAPENNALEAAADALPDAPAAPAAPEVPEQVPGAPAAPEVPEPVPGAPEVPEVPEPVPGAPEEVPDVPEPVPVGAPPPPPPPPAGPAPVIEGSAPLAKPFPDYATFAPMMARAIQMASVAPPAAAAAAAPGPPPAPAAPAAPAAVAAPEVAAPSEAEDRIAKTAALVLADQIDRMLILPEAVGITPDIERDRAVAREFRDRAANVTAAEWPGLQQEGEELITAIEEHIAAAPGDQGMNAAEYAAMDAVAPGQQEVVIPGAMPRAPPAASAAPAAVARAPAPDWRAALNAAAERRRAEAAAAAVVPAAAPAVADVVPEPAPVVPEPLPAAPAVADVVPAPVVPEPLPAAPAVADVVPAAAAVVPEPLPAAAPAAPAALPPHLRGAPLARQPALSREAIEALRAQAPAAPAPQPGRFRQFVRNLTRKNRAAPPAPAPPAAVDVVPEPEPPAPEPPAPEPPAPVDPIQAQQAKVDELVRRHQDILNREASLFAAKRRIPKATTALRLQIEDSLMQAENTLRLLRRNQAAAAGTGLVMNQPPAPADEEDGGRPEPPVAPVAPQTFAESAEAVRAIQEAQTPQANPFIVQAYRDSVEPPVAAENVAQAPAAIAAAPPTVPGATKLFGPLPGAQVGVRPEFAEAAAEGTRRAKRAQDARKTMRARRPLTEVPVLPLAPTAARAMVGGPIPADAPRFALENPMASGHLTLKKRLKEVPARLTKTQYDALDADMKPHFTKEERKFPGLPDMYSRNTKRVINPEGGRLRKRTLKNRRGLNKRKNVRGSRRR